MPARYLTGGKFVSIIIRSLPPYGQYGEKKYPFA